MAITEFKEGQLVIYKGANGYEIGKIKRIKNYNQAYVWYHSGDTAALTDFDLIKPIINDYCISVAEIIGTVIISIAIMIFAYKITR